MANHLMIDLETLDTKPSAVVLSVGYCVFNGEGLVKTGSIICNIESQLKSRRTVSASTLCWWMTQSDEARQAAFGEGSRFGSNFVKERLLDLIGNFEVDTVWTHGMTLDFPVLNSYLGVELFGFRQLRDTRTLAMVYPHVDRPQPKVAHDAGSDAEAQARWVILMIGGSL